MVFYVEGKERLIYKSIFKQYTRTMSHHHYAHHTGIKKRITWIHRFNTTFLIALMLVVISASILGLNESLRTIFFHIPWIYLLKALSVTLLRLVGAYVLAVVLGIGLALWAQSSPLAEELLLPLFDTLESVPVLVFFPVVVVFFIHLGLLNSAAIFIIFLNMLWNIVFNVIGGLKAIPQDIFSVAHVFHIRGIKKLFTILLPALVPSLVTGSLLAWAEGWNMIIVAEVLQTYVPSSLAVHNLFGIGSILVDASAQGTSTLFIGAVGIIILTIMLLNIFVWQKLLKYSEKFSFE
jgi:NitT/TauT family transport system permease protein